MILQEDNIALGEVVVTATYNKASANALYAKQKNMAAMSDGISADMMKKTSDNNVAQVLGPVAGVNIDNGKYVNVRGMGERYKQRAAQRRIAAFHGAYRRTSLST